MVSDKKLPPLAQRVSSTPLVVQAEKVGVYGGTLRRGLRGSSDHNGILRMVGNQGLVRWNMAFTEVLPCVAAKWEVNANVDRVHVPSASRDEVVGRQAVHRRRHRLLDRGLLQEHELYKSVPSALVIANKPGQAIKVNDTTVKFVFASPYALFLEQLATPLGQHPRCSQALLQPVPSEVQPNVAALAKGGNQSDWAALFRAKCGDIEIPSRWGNAEKPTLDPWILTEPYSGGVTRVVCRANPYFWQVDQTGSNCRTSTA
jgi:peptide/nickel transport system substrate-binding protein